MFGGAADGLIIELEPFVSEDITFSVNEDKALLTVRFASTALKNRPKFGTKQKREFDDLKQYLEEEVEGADVTSVISNFYSSMNNLPNNKKKRKLRTRGRKPIKAKDKEFLLFMKAAKFFHERGGAVLHPRQKLRLFGWLLQARNGNCDADPDLVDSSTLKGMQSLAWIACKNKTRREAMNTFVNLLSETVPNWRVSAILCDKTRQAKVRRMHATIYRLLANTSLTI